MCVGGEDIQQALFWRPRKRPFHLQASKTRFFPEIKAESRDEKKSEFGIQQKGEGRRNWKNQHVGRKEMQERVLLGSGWHGSG